MYISKGIFLWHIRSSVGVPPRDESPTEGMLKHTLDALLRTHITAFEALWEQPERLPNGLWKWDVRHSMWVERQKVSRVSQTSLISVIGYCALLLTLVLPGT